MESLAEFDPALNLQHLTAFLSRMQNRGFQVSNDYAARVAKEIVDAKTRWEQNLKSPPKSHKPLPPRAYAAAADWDSLPAEHQPRSSSDAIRGAISINGLKRFSTAHLKDLKPTCLRDMGTNGTYTEHSFVCRTFLPPVRDIAVNLFVEDVNGDAIMICAYNMPGTFKASPRQLEAHFPVGTILLVREPRLKEAGAGGSHMIIRVDSPSDLMFLTHNMDAVREYPWKSNSPDMSILANRSAEDWKAVGDGYFKEKMNVAALVAWTHARKMDRSGSLTTVPLNRAQAYLNMRWYSAAYADSFLAIKIASSHAHRDKAIYRSAVAQYGLGLYKEALDLLNMIGNNKEKEALTRQCAKRMKETDSYFDFLKLYRACSEKEPVPLDIADYVSPGIQVAEMQERGGGRGIKATRNIRAGELLMVQKPFVAVVHKDTNTKEPIAAVDCATGLLSYACQVAAVEQIVSRLLFCPEDAPRILDLYAGPEYPPPPSGYNLQPTPGHSLADPLFWDTRIQIDVARVDAIASFNAFDPHSLGPYIYGSGVDADSLGRSCALYTSPSLFNHACYHKAHRHCFGTTMVIRASMDILAGEEVTIPYLDDDTAFVREPQLKQFFPHPCDCIMCVEDKRDGADTCATRLAIAEELSVLSADMPLQARAGESYRLLKRMRETYPGDRPSGVYRPPLYRAYADAMIATENLGVTGNDSSKLKEAISLGVEALRHSGLEDIDSAQGNAAQDTRFHLPFSKRRVCHCSINDEAIRLVVHICSAFMMLKRTIRAERWYRGAWWLHDTCYGGGQGLFEERFKDELFFMPKPANMEYKWV